MNKCSLSFDDGSRGLALSAISTSSLIQHPTSIFLLLRPMSLLHIYSFSSVNRLHIPRPGRRKPLNRFISQYCNDDKSNGHVSQHRRIRVMGFSEVLFIQTKYSGYMWADMTFRGPLVRIKTKPSTQNMSRSHFTHKQTEKCAYTIYQSA